LGDAGAELDVLADCLAEGLVVGQRGLIQRLQVQRHKPPALLVGDLQVAVHVDDVLEAKPAGEAVRAPERLGHEPRQAIDVGRHALGEQRLQYRVGEGLGVEQLLEAM
jgi:hypothetical protein